MPPPKRRGRAGNNKPVGQPPSKKEKAAQMKKIFESSLTGDVEGVLSILNAWKDLQVSTTARYLQTEDPDGETCYQLALRGERTSVTRYKDPERADRCHQIAQLLLCASHQTIPVALKIWDWERAQPGQRFYGPDAKAPFQKGPTDPSINQPLHVPSEFKELEWTELHAAAHEGDLDRAAGAMRQGADPLKLDRLGHTPRAIAILGPSFNPKKAVAKETSEETSKEGLGAFASLVKSPLKPISLTELENEEWTTLDYDRNDAMNQVEKSVDDNGSRGGGSSNTFSINENEVKNTSIGEDDVSIGNNSVGSKSSMISKATSKLSEKTVELSESKKASCKLMADMLLTSYWLNVDEVYSEMAAESRRKLNSKRLEQALEAAALSAAREKLWWAEAAADNYGRPQVVIESVKEEGQAGGTAQKKTSPSSSNPSSPQNSPNKRGSSLLPKKSETDSNAKVSASAAATSAGVINSEGDTGSSIDKGQVASGGGVSAVRDKGKRMLKKNSSIKEAKVSTTRIHPNSWVAQAQAWAPTAIKWGANVANLFKGTSSSVMLGDVDLSKRKVEVDHLPKNETGPLSRAIGHNTFITHLDLSNLKLKDKGAISLGNAIVFNNKLEKLLLDNNDIGDEGARAISFGLTAHKQDYLRYFSLKDNRITDDGATMLLFSAWTVKCKPEDFSELRPAEILPMDKEDLLTLNLQNNRITEPVRRRLEVATEAVFIMRDPRERSAIIIQRCMKKKLERMKLARFTNAAETIQNIARYVWIPKQRMSDRVQVELEKFGYASSVAFSAAVKATRFYRYEPPPDDLADGNSVEGDGVEEVIPLLARRSSTVVQLADPGAYRKKERQKRRKVLECEAYEHRTQEDFNTRVERAKKYAEKESKQLRTRKSVLIKVSSFGEF